MLHPAEPFLETAGEDIRRSMFVTEGPPGERLALRPDFTIPVCLDASGERRGRRRAMPMRASSSAATIPAFAGAAGDRLRGYRPRRSAAADAEALALAVAAARDVAAAPLTVRLGDIGLFAALLARSACPAAGGGGSAARSACRS